MHDNRPEISGLWKPPEQAPETAATLALLTTEEPMAITIDVDHDLHDTLVDLVHDHGPQDVTWLTKRARRQRRDARIDEYAVQQVLEVATLLVVRPDGLVAHLADVLDGIVLTHRLRATQTERRDLWLGASAQPLLTMASMRPLRLKSGGEARIADSNDPALVGPPGWLPEAERGDLVALTWHDRELSVTRVDPDDLAGLDDQRHVRTLLAERCDIERWWNDDPGSRAGMLVRALGSARLEDPDLLDRPHPPLDELLYDPFERRAEDTWREFAAARQDQSIAFCIDHMPIALHNELRHRATQYAMSLDQFVIAILGHLAWRTPFAEDIEPWEQWDPEWRRKPNLIAFPGGTTPRDLNGDGPQAS